MTTGRLQRTGRRSTEAEAGTGLDQDGAARHEARHAVVARWAGFELTLCWIRRNAENDNFEGRTGITHYFPPRDRRRRVVQVLAGWVDEATGEVIDPGKESRDWQELTNLMNDLGWVHEKRQRRYDRAKRCAAAVVLREKAAVDAAARILNDNPMRPLGDLQRQKQAADIQAAIDADWSGERAKHREPPPAPHLADD